MGAVVFGILGIHLQKKKEEELENFNGFEAILNRDFFHPDWGEKNNLSPYELEFQESPTKKIASAHILKEIDTDLIWIEPFSKGIAYAIICGHFGMDAANLVYDKLLVTLEKNLNLLSIENTLKQTFLDLNQECLDSSIGQEVTLTLILHIGSTLWSANIGQARAIFSSNKNQRLFHLSKDTTLYREEYRKEVHKQGGKLIYDDGYLTVNKSVHPRSLGTRQAPKVTSALPELSCLELEEEEGVLVLFSPGLLAKSSSKQVAYYTYRKQRKTALQIAKGLIDTAYKAGSILPISVTVAKITTSKTPETAPVGT